MQISRRKAGLEAVQKPHLSMEHYKYENLKFNLTKKLVTLSKYHVIFFFFKRRTDNPDSIQDNHEDILIHEGPYFSLVMDKDDVDPELKISSSAGKKGKRPTNLPVTQPSCKIPEVLNYNKQKRKSARLSMKKQVGKISDSYYLFNNNI
jgi:hypothetical protein